MIFRTLIDANSLRGLLGNPAVAILDCRFDLMNPDAGPRAYESGHIPGARYLHLDRDLAGPIDAASGRHPLPAPQAFADRLGSLGVGNGTQVVAYDDANGSFAARIWWMLRWLGHEAVAVLDGGFKAWVADGGALESGAVGAPAASVPRQTFAPHVTARAWLTTNEVVAALGTAQALLVDARAPERFAGSVEPIDAVAGHVPGAVNHPFSSNLSADNRFLPAGELRARWQKRLAGKSPEELISMCGSGVTACHNLLALEIAGLPGAKLYAGSWSEWIRDPQRPTARG